MAEEEAGPVPPLPSCVHEQPPLKRPHVSSSPVPPMNPDVSAVIESTRKRRENLQPVPLPQLPPGVPPPAPPKPLSLLVDAAAAASAHLEDDGATDRAEKRTAPAAVSVSCSARISAVPHAQSSINRTPQGPGTGHFEARHQKPQTPCISVACSRPNVVQQPTMRWTQPARAQMMPVCSVKRTAGTTARLSSQSTAPRIVPRIVTQAVSPNQCSSCATAKQEHLHHPP